MNNGGPFHKRLILVTRLPEGSTIGIEYYTIINLRLQFTQTSVQPRTGHDWRWLWFTRDLYTTSDMITLIGLIWTYIMKIPHFMGNIDGISCR